MTTHDAPTDPELLASDGDYDDDWEDTPIVPRARTPWLTKLLAAAVIAALAFAGGVYAQKQWGKSSSSSTGTGSNAASRFGGGFAGSARRAGGSGGFGGLFGGSSANGQGGSATSGQVSFVKGSTLYVADLTGSTVKVSVRGARVTKTSTVTPAAIRPGDTVVIVGTKRADGSVAATSITVGGSTASLFGGG